MANFQEALKILRATRVKKGDSPQSACRSDRMNAIIDGILGLARGDHFGRGTGIRMRKGPDGVILSGDASGKGDDGSGTSFPFEMTETTDSFDIPAVSIAPGMLEDVMPLLSGERLDANPAPFYYPAFGITHLFLRVYVITDPDNAYRQAIDPTITVVEEGDSDQEVLTVEWDDPSTRENGNFYVKLGIITHTAASGDSPESITIKQVLFNNLMSLVYIGNDVTILAASVLEEPAP